MFGFFGGYVVDESAHKDLAGCICWQWCLLPGNWDQRNSFFYSRARYLFRQLCVCRNRAVLVSRCRGASFSAKGLTDCTWPTVGSDSDFTVSNRMWPMKVDANIFLCTNLIWSLHSNSANWQTFWRKKKTNFEIRCCGRDMTEDGTQTNVWHLWSREKAHLVPNFKACHLQNVFLRKNSSRFCRRTDVSFGLQTTCKRDSPGASVRIRVQFQKAGN